MQEMNRCPRCKKLLVLHENVQAIKGKLYCSRLCAVHDIASELWSGTMAASSYNEAFEVAKEYFDECAETVRTEEILAEDLQEVQIAVTFYKTVKVPKCLTREKALEVVEKMWNDGTITAEPDDCDDVNFECELVERHNSSCEEVYV